jgi:hypothetical protein
MRQQLGDFSIVIATPLIPEHRQTPDNISG